MRLVMKQPGTLNLIKACERCGQERKDLQVTRRPGGPAPGQPSGGPVPVHSIQKNHVLPGFGPTDLYYGKNGYVLTFITSEIVN